MKKIVSLSLTLLFFSYSIKAQQELIKVQTETLNPSILGLTSLNTVYEKASTAVITDTLDYFFNKHYYKNNTSTNLQFTTLKSPYPSNSLNIEHCGAVFLNSANITVSGLKGLVIKNAGSVSLNVPVKLYLCYVGLTQLPIMPPLDSVSATISGTAGVWVGGTFSAPVTVTNNFAVLFKCASTVAGDTVRLFLNNAFTSTATTVPVNQRYGEGFGLIRFNGNFQKTTGAFGGSAGNDYEFVVAPYVEFSMTAAGSALSPTICNYTSGSFTNLSTPMSLIENRQFNFNKFKPYWSPLNTAAPPSTDSIYSWSFTGSSTPPTTNKSPSAFFNTLGTQSANLTVKYRRSHGSMGPSLTDAAAVPIDVNIGSAPVISVSGTTAFCTTSPAVTASLFCTGSTSYTWSAPVNSVSAYVTITQTASSMVYTVTAQNGGCASVKLLTITINPPPSVSLTPNKSNVCTTNSGGAGVTLTGQPSGGVFSGTNVSGSTFNPASVGMYSPVYSYTNMLTTCSNTATASILVTNCTGLNQKSNNEGITAFPNPSLNGIITLKNLEGTNAIELINILGQPLLKLETTKQEVEIDLSREATGSYFLKVTNSNGDLKILKIVNQN